MLDESEVKYVWKGEGERAGQSSLPVVEIKEG